MADEQGEYWYLEPETDPAKIKVPQLRSILLKHGITYLPSAKKPELLELFVENVLPQAAKLNRAHARTKRSTRGIEDVPSSASITSTDDQEDETLLAPPPSARRPVRRARGATEEAPETRTPARARSTRAATDEAPPSRRLTTKTPSRTVPTKHARADDEEPQEQPTARRNRTSATPAKPKLIKEESAEPEAWHRHDEASPFTQENPFQSGSSPAGVDSVARERRRKTHGFEQQRERRKSDALRRKTYEPNVEQRDEGIVVPSRSNFEMRVSRPRATRPEPPVEEPPVEEVDPLEPGEEFTPEERLELVRERAAAGEVDILPPRRRKQPRQQATGTVKAFLATLFVTAAGLTGGAWRQEKLAVGFCGVGRESTSLAGVEVPDWAPEWAHDLLPQCEPCPPHATCYQDLVMVCDKDFLKKEHPLSLNGLIPLPATCEPDSEKTRRIGLVADRTVQVLRERNAKYECGETDSEGHVVKSPQVSEEDLKKELSSVKRKDMSQEDFDDLFESAIGEVVRREEIVESTNATSSERVLASNSLAELSFVCSIKRNLRHTVERYLWQAAIVFLLTISGLYGRYSLNSNRAMEAQAKKLATNVFNELANHAALNLQDPGSYPDRGISMAQLRDDVLREEFSAAKRQKLWERVQKKIEHNANVRAAVRENHTGDVARMWEWVGTVKLLEDRPSTGRKRESARFSYGSPAYEDSPAQQLHREGDLPVQKWDEGHPIY